ncbi:hypothetical protein EJ110_NYTH49531 [Nymphaea thermarum]|nr:hypothetical protein EJ110_NYTH49531 [Nymphaea thermarum]
MGLVKGYHINGLPGVGEGNNLYPGGQYFDPLGLSSSTLSGSPMIRSPLPSSKPLLPAKAQLRISWTTLTTQLPTMLGSMPLNLSWV